MSRLQNTVRDEASCRWHGPRRDRRARYIELVPFEMRITAETVIRALAEDDGTDALHMEWSGQ